MGNGKIVVALSGGQDSTTVLFWAKAKFSEVHTITVHYGQRHAAEIGAAAMIANAAGVSSHVVVPLFGLFEGSTSALVDPTRELRGDGGMADSASPGGLPTSFVPARNLVIASLAVARAGVVGANAIGLGVCETDYSGYPDCRSDFIRALQGAVNEGWPDGHMAPVIYAPLMHLSKADTVRLSVSDDVAPGCVGALAHSITCYHGKNPGCGECPSCVLRAKGYAEAGIVDPALAK